MSGSSLGSNAQSRLHQGEALGSPGPTVYRPSYEQLWHDYEQLQGNFQATRAQLERTQIELDETLNRAAYDQTQRTRLQSKIQELEDLVQKQKMTISTQSKTISDPKNLKSQHGFSGTPQKRSSHHNLLETPHSQRHGVFDRTPPLCDVSGHPSSRNGGLRNQQHLQPYAPDIGPVSPTKGSFLPSQNGLMMMPEDLTAEFSSGFQSLWLKAETFGHLHANFPDVQRDSRIEPKAKQVLMSVSDQSTASFLLNNSSTRFFLVAKVINNLMTREVLKITVIKGFNGEVDSEIGQIKRQIFPDTPPTVRSLLHTAIANQFTELRRKPGFDEFFQHRIHENTTKLWSFIAPLMHESSENGWNDLIALMTDAHNLALKMFSGPHEFKFEYANTGDLFNPNFMVNRDSHISGDPQMLMRNQYRVKLGITPTINFRNHRAASSDPKVVHYGGVLLRPPFRNPHV